MNLKAKDVMNQEILSVNDDWSIQQLSDFLVENSISGASVVDSQGKLIGVVSLTDIVRNKSKKLQNEINDETHDYYLNVLEKDYEPDIISTLRIQEQPTITIKDIMTPMIFKVQEDTPIQKVAEAMIKGRIHRVFVTQKDKQIGIITTMDLLKVIQKL